MRPLFNFQRLLKLTDVKLDDSSDALLAKVAQLESLAEDMANAEYSANSLLQTQSMRNRLQNDEKLRDLASRIAVVTQIDENFAVTYEIQPYTACHSSEF
jgi:hypothetical protein